MKYTILLSKSTNSCMIFHQDIETDEHYQPIDILEEHNKYIPFLLHQDSNRIALYISNDNKLDVTSKVFNEDYRRYYIGDTLDLRNKKLTDTDWTRLDDNNIDDLTRDAWKEYRQKLRDLPESVEYGEGVDSLSVMWPPIPSA